MTEAWAGTLQEQAQATQDAALSNAWALLTTEVWAIIALTVAAMAFGIAVFGVIRNWMDEPEPDAPLWMGRAYKKKLTRLGMASSGLWALVAVSVYLLLFVGVHWLAALVAAVFSGFIAAACNGPAYKVLKAAWHVLWLRWKRSVEAKHGPDDSGLFDQTMTFLRGKKK